MSASASFWAIASLFKEKIFVNLVAYADESGTHDSTVMQQGSQVAGVLGWVAPVNAWKDFTIAWDAVLKDYGIRVFHMSVFIDKINGPKKKEWPYLGWSDERRDAFIRELIPI